MEFQVYIYEIVDDQIVRSRIIEHSGAFCINTNSDTVAFYLNTSDRSVSGLGYWYAERIAKTGFYLLSKHEKPMMLIHVDSEFTVRKATDTEVSLFNAGIDWAEHAIPSVNFLLHNFLKVGANGLADIIKDGMTKLHVAPTVY